MGIEPFSAAKPTDETARAKVAAAITIVVLFIVVSPMFLVLVPFEKRGFRGISHRLLTPPSPLFVKEGSFSNVSSPNISVYPFSDRISS
jgi:hypothetical protein